MAEESATKETTASEKQKTETPTSNELETTTAKDGSLPINVSVPVATETVPPATPPVTTAEPEKPIVVSEADLNLPVEAPESKETDHTQITTEIENLSGEIQALEAKIDRLTGNIKTVENAPEAPMPAKEVVAPVEPKVETKLEAKEEMKSTPEISTDPKKSPVDDIYSRVAAQEKNQDGTLKTPDSDEAQELSTGSSVGVIGEVLIVFGVITFILMGAYPLYSSLLSADIGEAVKLIGWPTTVVGLAIGSLLSLFSKGKLATKIIGFIILLISIVFYFGIAGFERFLGPLAGMLESVFSFYR